MKLSECKPGTVVGMKDESHLYHKYFPRFLGHIIGLFYIEYDNGREVIAEVQWCNGTKTSIHPSNIEIFND